MPRSAAAALVVATLLLAACGGDDDTASDTTATVRTPSGGATVLKLTPTPTATPSAEPKAPERVFDARDAASFAELAASIGGEVGIAAGPPGAGEKPQELGSLTEGSAWSTIKVAIALRAIEQAGGSPTPEQQDLIARALTTSDNAAADELFASLADTDTARAAEVQRVLREAGDDATTVSDTGRDGFSPYGQTVWSLAAQQQFMAALAGGCLPKAAGAATVLDQMAQVAPDQRWGLGQVGDTPRFKGGWGPGTDGRYLVRQMGVVDVDGEPVVVALAALPEDGQFATGTQMLDQLAAWTANHATPVKAVPC